MSFLIDILTTVVIIFAAAAVGRKIIRALNLPASDFWIDFCSSAALGIGMLILSVFFLGIGGLLHRWILILPPLVFVAAAPSDFVIILTSIVKKTAAFHRGAPTLSRIIASSTVIFFILYLPSALTPPVHPDALVYQLAAPKIYMQSGRIIFLPDNFRASLPSGVNMLFTLGLVLRGYALAQLFHLALGFLSSLALYAVGKHRFGASAGLWAAFIFSSLYIVSLVAPQAMTELGCVLFAVLAFDYLYSWRDSNAAGEFIMSALFCGFALTTRYQAALWLACLAGMIFISDITRRAQPAKTVLRPILYIAIAVAVLSPWMIRNAADTGNPFFPVFNTFFGNRYYDAGSGMWMISGVPGPTSLADGMRRFFLFPWLAVSHGFSADTGFGPPASPVFLALLPALIFFRPLPRYIKNIFFFCLPVGAISILMNMVTIRFWLPVEALLCVALGYIASASRRRARAVFYLFAFFAAANALFTFTSLWSGNNSIPKQLSVLIGTTSKDDYIAEQVNAYAAIDTINRELPQKSKVLLGFMTGQGYYLERPYLYGELYNQTYLDWARLRNTGELMRWLLGHGVTHILYHETFSKPGVCSSIFVPVGAPGSMACEELLQKHVKPVRTVEHYIIGEIEY